MTAAEDEAKELAGMDMPEFDVAVVVFVRSQGVDEDDARDRAAGSVKLALNGGTLKPYPFELPLNHRGSLVVEGKSVIVSRVVELARAAANGYISASPSVKPFRDSGMKKIKS